MVRAGFQLVLQVANDHTAVAVMKGLMATFTSRGIKVYRYAPPAAERFQLPDELATFHAGYYRSKMSDSQWCGQWPESQGGMVLPQGAARMLIRSLRS